MPLSSTDDCFDTQDTSTKNINGEQNYDFLEASYNIIVELWVINELPHSVILNASEKHCHYIIFIQVSISIGRKEHYAYQLSI